jgi:hypothetical protein
LTTKKMSGEDGQDANRKFLESLQRLAAMLKDLDEKSTKQQKQKQGVEPRGLPLSHWRELTSEVEGAYQMLTGGAALVHSTSTKYTLVGKIDSVEGAKLSVRLDNAPSESVSHYIILAV